MSIHCRSVNLAYDKAGQLGAQLHERHLRAHCRCNRGGRSPLQQASFICSTVTPTPSTEPVLLWTKSRFSGFRTALHGNSHQTRSARSVRASSHAICNSSSAMTRDSPVPVRSVLCFAILSRMVYDGGPGPHIQSLHTMTLSMLRHTEWSLHVWTMTMGPTGEGMRRYMYQLRSGWALAGNSVSAQRSPGT